MTDSVFFSHSTKTSLGQVGTKLLKIHTEGVTQKAIKSCLETLNFSISTQAIIELLESVCELHDLGKYTEYFQNYLLKIGKVNKALKNHSQFGAYVAFEKHKNEDIATAIFAYFLIISHHGNLENLLDWGHKEDSNSKHFKEVFEAQKKSILKRFEKINEEIKITNLTDL
jgi:CRISPR-associated endonuclease/helicase Cas3